MPHPYRLVITCEHAGNVVPPEYRHLFKGEQRLLDSHRGYDPGTAELGRRFARAFDAPLLAARVTRLLVDLNRSMHNRTLFSAVTRQLSAKERAEVLERYYHPHRRAVEKTIRERLGGHRTVVHLAVHSFTPLLEGTRRRADVGLLYDPRRSRERSFCQRWQDALLGFMPSLRVRRNYPYRGSADGLTTYLRTILPATRYLGIEIEVNQRFPTGPSPRWQALQAALLESLRGAWASP